MCLCPRATYWGLILMVAARKMESVASFFIHDDSDGPSVAHIAEKTAAHTVCRPQNHWLFHILSAT